MSDEREFRIKITGDASSLVGESQRGGLALAELTDAEKQTLEGMHGAGAAAGKMGEGVEEAGKGVKIFNTHGREMHALIHGLDQVVPGAGLALRGLFNPSTLGIAAVVLILHELVKLAGQYKQKLEEAAKAQAQLETARWEAQRNASKQAVDNAQAYSEKLKAIAENSDALKEQEDKQLAVLKAIEGAHRNIIKAMEEAEMAAAKGDKVQEEAIRRRYEGVRREEELAAGRAEIAQKEKFLAEERVKAEEALEKSRAAGAAKTAGAPGGAEAEVAAGEVGKDKAKVEAAQKAFNQAQNEIDKPIVTTGIFGDSAPYTKGVEASRQKALDKAAQELEQTKMAMEADEDAVKRHKDATEALMKAEEKATAAYDKLAETVRHREAEIDKDKAVAAENEAGAARVQEIERQAVLSKAGWKPGSVAGRILLGDIRAEEGLAHGEKLTESQTQGIDALRMHLRAAGNNQEQINRIIKDMMDVDKTQEAKLNELGAALRILQNQIRSRNLNAGG